jgi:hypothetical protein
LSDEDFLLTDLSPHRPQLSVEARVLLQPAAVLHTLAPGPGGGAWMLVRRPLLLSVMLGCSVSLQRRDV